MPMKALELLKHYSGKQHAYLTQRGNKAIEIALKYAKEKGCSTVVIQNQGGWITYPQYAEQLKMAYIEVNTSFGVINTNELAKFLDPKTVVLVNSLAGYYAEQPMGMISGLCRQKGSLLINDASGSIGTENAKIGDVIIGSFGDDKPVGLGYGGFIACNERLPDKLLGGAVFDNDKIPFLEKKLNELPLRRRELEKHSQKIKEDLADLQVLHKDSRGINVVIRFSNPGEKERIINYCQRNHYQFVECPKYWKVNVPAISIEVKRL